MCWIMYALPRMEGRDVNFGHNARNRCCASVKGGVNRPLMTNIENTIEEGIE